MDFVNYIITLGQFVIGCVVLVFVVVAVIAVGVEIYDRVKERDETHDDTKARLKSLKDGNS